MKKKTVVLKKLNFKSACLAFVFTTACMAQMSELIIDPKVGFNGGFEVSQNNLPVNWLVYTQNTTKEGKFFIKADSTVYLEGKKSLHFKIEQCSAKGGRFSPGIAQEIKVNVGETYKIKAKLRNHGTKFTLHVTAVNAFNHGEAVELHPRIQTTEWIEYSTTIKIPEKMERLRIELNVVWPGELWLDDVQMNKLP